jgi:hypothetical protein
VPDPASSFQPDDDSGAIDQEHYRRERAGLLYRFHVFATSASSGIRPALSVALAIISNIS